MRHSLLIALTVLGVAAAPLTLPAAELRPDNQGYIRDWLMLAPIPLEVENEGSLKIDEEQVNGERDLKPKAGDKSKALGKELTWKSVKAREASFDINALLNAQLEYVAAYMVTYVVADRDMSGLTLLMGSNDQGKVYLNGRQVVKHTEPRSLEIDGSRADKVSLQKGVNVIVFKVINDNNNWEGCLRFVTSDGKPVTDVKIQLAP